MCEHINWHLNIWLLFFSDEEKGRSSFVWTYNILITSDIPACQNLNLVVFSTL